MFAQVVFLTQFSEPLLYQVPKELQASIAIGSLVKVPLRSRIISGIVISLQKNHTQPFVVKAIIQQIPFPNDTKYLSFIKKLAEHYHVPWTAFLKRLQSFFAAKKEVCLPTTEQEDIQSIMLTEEQQAVVDYVTPHIINPSFKPTLLHGVTGSGKTEVYKQVIMHAIQENKSVLLLLPEVALAVQFEILLKKQLNCPIVSFHSGTDAITKKVLWKSALNNKPQVIIGVHLPPLIPLSNLGLIIIDEEHESGYQEKKHPKINTKEAALLRAQFYNIPLLLGSATPSISSLHAVNTKQWQLFTLHKRFAGAFPKIKLVELKKEAIKDCFWISKTLLYALKQQLGKKEQTILFLNRRGLHFFVQCKRCTFVFECSSCSVSLTMHADNTLRCHYCGYIRNIPQACSECHNKELLKKGVGTQSLVQTLQKLLPSAHIARADMDTTKNRKTWQKTMEGFQKGTIDILVGTQTITKGYHFPNVTLVGIIWADSSIHFPFYNAQETALQQLIQVAGRAGRVRTDSTVIVQTLTQHPVFAYVNEKQYQQFYEHELAARKSLHYPPCGRLVELELKHIREVTVENEAAQLAAELMKHKALIVLGPVTPVVAKIKKVFRKKLYLKAETYQQIHAAYKTVAIKKYKSSIAFTPNPQSA